jgi:predicted DNA-binding transcriptional regulator AlpA
MEQVQQVQIENENDWLDPQGVANYLGISLSEVYSQMRQTPPPYPFYRVTTTKRNTKRADLDAWLEKVKVSAVEPEEPNDEGDFLK